MTFMARASLRLICSAASLLLPMAASASTIIPVINGSFEQTASSGTSQQLGYNGFNVTGWTNNSTNGTLGYNFLFTSGTATASGDAGSVALWNSSNGGLNAIPASPLGGNFLAMDGAYQVASVSQLLSGLTVGMDTKVSFYYAGAQQTNHDGATTEAFKVSLTDNTGNNPKTATDMTPVLTDASHGFTGWQYITLDFVPTATSETLSFLAVGTPSGVPPFSLLDGVSVVQVTPEPSTLALLGSGVLAVGGLVRRRRSRLS